MKLSSIVNYATSTGSMLVGVVAQSFAFLIIARYLGKTNYGQLATLTAVISICAPWVQMGTAELVRRRIAIDRRQYPEILGHSVILLFGVGFIVALLVSGVLSFFVHFGSGAVKDFLVIWMFCFCGLVLYPWMVLIEQIFLAHEMLTRANFTNAGFGAWRTIIAAVACIGFGARSVADWAVWNFAAYTIASILGALAIARFGAPSIRIIRRELILGATFGVSGFLYNLRQNIDILCLSVIATPDVVGSFGLARRIISITYVMSASLDRLIYGQLVKASQSGLQRTASVAIKFAYYAVIIAVVTVIVLCIASNYLVLTFFGSTYREAVPLVRILSGLIILVALQNLAFDALNSANRHKMQIAISSASVLVGAMSVVFFTFQFGVNGAVFGLYVMELLLAVALWAGLMGLVDQKSFQRVSTFFSRSAQVPRR